MELTIEPIVQEQTTEAVSAAKAIVITDQETYDQAATALRDIKNVGKLIAEKKDAIVKPLNASLKAARDLFRPFEVEQTGAETVIKQKMIAYRNKVEAEAQRKEEALQARVDKEGRGRLNVETAIQKATEIEHVVVAKGETYRNIKKVRITDVAMIPGKYFIVDEVALRRDALATGGLGEVIPGCEVYEESSLAV